MSAASGSLDDLQKLFSLIRDSPQAQLRLFIPAFYANLNVDDIPELLRQPDTDMKNRVLRVIVALGALSHLQEHMVSRACGEVWSSAWTWIQFLEQCGETAPSHRRLYLTVMFSLSTDAETLATIINTPGVRALFAKGWVAAVDDLNSPELFHDLCNYLINYIEPKDPQNLNELIEGAGGTADDLASLIIKHIRRAIPSENHTVDPEDGFTLLAVSALLDIVGPLSAALAAQGIVGCILTVIFALCGPAMVMTEQMIPLSISTLFSQISQPPGFPWVKDALDSGLLRAIVLCASRRTTIMDISLYRLFTILPGSLVYYSVLSSLRAALDEVKDLADTPEFTGSVLFPQWTAFVDLATERLAVMDRYDRGELGAQRACDNLECGAIQQESALLRCTACRSAFYCSQACQTADWKASHRKLCATSANRPHEECPQLTLRDRDFLRVLLHHDYEAVRGEVLTRQIEYLHRGEHPGMICYVKFDYRMGRAEVETGPASPVGSDQAARVARSGGRMELHAMVVKEGSKHSRGHMVPLRLADGRVQERMAVIAASGGTVVPAVMEELLGLEVVRTH
ncbi:hypothetical protein B0H11DRAFT_77679 [Mycena galericulata]|nr:hypothetical protein B0H11DRAFT_77679 [Mycena galericulata]